MSVSEPAAVSAATYDKRFGLFGAVAAGVWLIFLAPALQRAWEERSTWVGWVGLAALLGFGALYVAVFQWARPMRRSGALWRSVQPASLVWLALLVVLAAVMVLTLQYDGLGAAVYLAVAAVTLLPQRWSIPTALVLAVGAEAMARLLPGWVGADGIGLSVALATFAIWGMWQAMRRSMDLARAREENAQLLLGQERARISRDLHDLLGHSLTVIAVKAELAVRGGGLHLTGVDLCPWSCSRAVETIRGRWVSSWRGSARTRTAGTTWRGCAGLTVSSVLSAGASVGGSWRMAGGSASRARVARR